MRTDRQEPKQAEAARRDGAAKRDGARGDGGRKAASREVVLRGIPITPVVAIGPVFDTSEIPAETPRRAIPAYAVEAERARLLEAVALSRKQLGKLKAKLALKPILPGHGRSKPKKRLSRRAKWRWPSGRSGSR